MKKRAFAIILTVCFGILSLPARPVSQEQAMQVARRVLKVLPATKGAAGDLRIIWDGEQAGALSVRKKGAQPAFYVIGQDGGGFVIVAGDDRVTPVLGFSARSVFRVEGMPDNVRWWMERMKAYVRTAGPQSEKTAGQWAELAATKAGAALDPDGVTVVKEWHTPEWDQGNNDLKRFNNRYIFNTGCPMQNGRYTLTGCVATSIGEVITCLSGIYPDAMPSSAVPSTIQYMAVKDGFLANSPRTLGASYDWEGLRSLTDTVAIRRAIDEGKDALLDDLGRLLGDIGAIMEAEYSTKGTSATQAYVAARMADRFYFNKAAYYEKEADYTGRRWVEKLKAELDQRPILYSGRTSDLELGHSFVYDGYGTYGGDVVFHINFGWSGTCNGYYRHIDMATASGDDFSYDCAAVFDFYPDAGSVCPKIMILSEQGLYLNEGETIEKDRAFSVNYRWLINNGNEPYAGKVKIVLEDKDGAVKQDELSVLDYTDRPILSGRGWGSSRKVTITVEPAFGDRIVMYYTTDDSNTVWERVIYHTDGSIVGEIPVMPATFIATAASYRKGDWFDLRLKNIGRRYTGTEWTIVSPGGSVTVLNQSDREYQLNEAGSYRIEAAVAESPGSAVTEHVVAFITVK